MTLNTFLRTLVGILFGLVAFGCGPKPSTAILQREWTVNAEFAGDVLAIDFARTHGLTLEVREGSDLIDPIKMVRSGTAQFGVASSDRVLRENEGGAGLTIVAVATYRSPVVFLTNPNRGIRAPADFPGHTIGIQAGTNTDLIFQTLVNKQKLSNMKVVESGWGTKNFEAGALDVLAAFDYDEPVQLDLKQFAYGVIRPEDYDVRFVGTVYFTSRALIAQNPKLVQDFVSSLVAGWKRALADTPAAIAAVATRFPHLESKKEQLSLDRGRPYFSGEDGKLLYTSQERWNDMGRDLISLGSVKSFSFRDNIDYRFLEEALAQGPPR